MGRLYDKAELGLGIALLAVITALVFIAAVMRFAGNPVIWSVDLAQLLFIWVCFIGATRAMRQKAHLGVDYLVRLFPHRLRLMLETAMAAFFILFLLTLTIEGYKLTMLNWARVFGDSGLSYAWVTIAVPAGSILLICSILANLVDAWRNPRHLVYTRTSAEFDETGTAESV